MISGHPDHRNAPDRRTRSGGFTLVELIAVLVVVSILAAVSVPTLSSLGDTRASMAARHLARDLSFARQRAVATGTRTWVLFDTAAESWEILGEDPDNPGRANATALTDLATGEDFAQTLGTGSFAGVQVVSAAFDGDVQVGFDWLGRALNATETLLAARGTVTLSGSHVVNVEATTGFVSHVGP